MAYNEILPSALQATTGTGNSAVFAADTPLRAYLILTASTTPTTLDVDIEELAEGTWRALASFTQLGAVATGFESIAIAAPHVGTLRAGFTIVGGDYTFEVGIRSF